MKSNSYNFRLLFMILLTAWSGSALAHHILGRPSYSLGDDSNTPPSMQIETQIGRFFVRSMVFPAFPQPGETSRINLYASDLNSGAGFAGTVRFTARDDVLFGQAHEDLLGEQQPDDGVFRQAFVFPESGRYIITAAFEHGGEPYRIDFPVTIGRPFPIGPVGLVAITLLVLLIGVNLVLRRRLQRDRIRSARMEDSS